MTLGREGRVGGRPPAGPGRAGDDGNAVHLGPGADRVYGGAGSEGIYVRDDGAVDVVFCGPGHDRVWHGGEPDPLDRLHGCEEVSDHP